MTGGLPSRTSLRPFVGLLKVLAAAVLIAAALGAAGLVSSVLLGPSPESLSGYVPTQVSKACADYAGSAAAAQTAEYGGGGTAPVVQCEEPLPR